MPFAIILAQPGRFSCVQRDSATRNYSRPFRTPSAPRGGGRRAPSAVAPPVKLLDRLVAKIDDEVGGRGNLPIVILLASVLALEMADMGTISAVSGSLKHVFGIGNTRIGLLMAVVSFVGAAAALPFGILVDRGRRKTILMVAVTIWAMAMVASGTASSYGYMLGARIFLGGIVAVATPCVASLTGDFFHPGARARIYGIILGGELVGAGIGFLVSGEVSSWASWRWSFYVMAVPSVLLLLAIWRWLPEPQRGAQSWSAGDGEEASPSLAAKVIAESDAEPREPLVLKEDPTRWSIWRTVKYCLRLPTYGLLIAASALGYYFFSGVRGFGMIYFTGHYGLPRSIVSALIIVPGIGAVIGSIAGGRISEWLLRRGHISARVLVPAAAVIICIPPFGFSIWTDDAAIGVILLTIGAAALAAAMAPMDAARLDIIEAHMWGRAEAGRRTLRSTLEGSAPLLFGAMSHWLGHDQESGLKWTFLLMLGTLILASLLAVFARRTYPRDVATAEASRRNVDERTG